MLLNFDVHFNEKDKIKEENYLRVPSHKYPKWVIVPCKEPCLKSGFISIVHSLLPGHLAPPLRVDHILHFFSFPSYWLIHLSLLPDEETCQSHSNDLSDLLSQQQQGHLTLRWHNGSQMIRTHCTAATSSCPLIIMV